MICMMVNAGSCIPHISDMVLCTVYLLLIHIAHLLPLYTTNKNVKLKLGLSQK